MEVLKDLERIIKKYSFVDYAIEAYKELQKQGIYVNEKETSGWIVAYKLLNELKELVDKYGK